MTQEQKEVWKVFRESENPDLTNKEYEMIAKLHAELLGHEVWKPCTCDTEAFQNMISDINKKYDG